MRLSKAEMQLKIEKLEKEEAKSLTYSGLASLIIDQGENDKEWREDFNNKLAEFKDETKDSLKEVKDYNEKQNGRQADMLKKIYDLEEESLKRGLTCKLAVEEMQKVSKEKKVEKKEDAKVEKTQKLSKRQWILAILLTALIGGPSIIDFINWIFK